MANFGIFKKVSSLTVQLILIPVGTDYFCFYINFETNNCDFCHEYHKGLAYLLFLNFILKLKIDFNELS